jgi:F-type H+-transporting ATPase subunit epsilon
VTPEKAVYEADATYANLPAFDGQMGVLANRAAVVVQLGSGTLAVQQADGKLRRFAISGGFAQMNKNRLTLLSEKAEDLDHNPAEVSH